MAHAEVANISCLVAAVGGVPGFRADFKEGA